MKFNFLNYKTWSIFLVFFIYFQHGIAMELKEPGLYAQIQTTKGDIWAKLFHNKVPITVTNFIGLAETDMDVPDAQNPFYSNILFHRVIENFMIQTGDPTGTGRGGPNYRFNDEFDSTLKHNKPGILSMANAGPGTNGSQFFITHAETPWLDNKHSIFGEVIFGQDTVDAIAQGDYMHGIKIHRIGEAFKDFKANKTILEDLLKDE